VAKKLIQYSESDLRTPLEQPSALRRAGNAMLGGFSSLGNLLDTPGSMVRDVLAFENPFDQLLSPFSSENRTTGRDLLRKSGLAGDEDSWGNLAAGIGLEFALDPLTYLTLGGSAALTGGGKAAKAAGMLDKAADVATAARVAKGAASAAPKLTDLATATSKAAMLDAGGDAAKALEKAGLSGRSTFASTVVGPREAKRTMSLGDLLQATQGDARQTAIKNLDEYAKKLGMQDHAELLAKHGSEPLAHSGRVGVPLTNIGQTFESSALDRVGRWLDLAGHYTKWSAPGRAARLLFAPKVKGGFTREEQLIGEAITPLEKVGLQKAHAAAYEALNGMNDAREVFQKTFQGEALHGVGKATPEFTISGEREAMDALMRIGRLAAELKGASPEAELGRAVDTLLPHARKSSKVMPPELESKIVDVIGKMRQAKDLMHADLLDSGIKTKHLDFDFLSHFPRYGVPKEFSETQAFQRRLAPSSGTATASRIKQIAHLPAEVVEALLSDPLVRAKPLSKHEKNLLMLAMNGAPPPALGHERALELIKDWTGPISYTNKRGQTKNISVAAQAKAATKYVKSHSDRFLPTADSLGDKMFANSPVEDFGKHMASAHRLAATRDGVFATLHSAVDDMRRAGNYAGPTKTVAETLDKAGYDVEKALVRMAKGANVADPMAYAKELGSMPVASEVSDAITSMVAKSTSPRWANLATFYWDKVSRVLKENLTLPFPGFYVRNFFSGQMMNAMSNHINTLGDIGEYADEFQKSVDVMKNPQNHADFLREMHVHGVYQYGQNAADIPDYVKMQAGTMLPTIKDAVTESLKEKGPTMLQSLAGKYSPAAGDAIGKVVNPLRSGHETVLEFGRRASALGEWYNRVPMYRYLRRKGYAPEVAAQMVKDIHVDYGDLTGFEKDIGRRAALFYTFTRKQMEQTALRLMEQPGGIPGLSIAGTVKGINKLRNPGELLPDYIAETASIPVGADEEGNKNFITGFGLAFEDPLSFFGKGVRGSGMELLSRAHPLIKGPLEYATGEMFFQAGPGGGRDIKDADPLLGRTLANVMGREQPIKIPELAEVAIANSPASRLLSTTRQLADPRKDLASTLLTLGSGMRVATVSPAASEGLLREAAAEQLRSAGGRQFVRTYLPDYAKAGMSPQDLADAQELVGTMNELARRTKARKEIKKAKEAKEAAGG